MELRLKHTKHGWQYSKRDKERTKKRAKEVRRISALLKKDIGMRAEVFVNLGMKQVTTWTL